MQTYDVTIGGVPMSIQLDDAEAVARGLKAPANKKAPAPENKAQATEGKTSGSRPGHTPRSK